MQNAKIKYQNGHFDFINLQTEAKEVAFSLI